VIILRLFTALPVSRSNGLPGAFQGSFDDLVPTTSAASELV
jgi:hypothetical protein